MEKEEIREQIENISNVISQKKYINRKNINIETIVNIINNTKIINKQIILYYLYLYYSYKLCKLENKDNDEIEKAINYIINNIINKDKQYFTKISNIVKNDISGIFSSNLKLLM